MKKSIFLLVTCLSALNFAYAQPSGKNYAGNTNAGKASAEKTVANVGREKISSSEYKVRYELMPHISKNQDLTDSLKNEFLYSLIAEKLWAMEASEKGWDTSAVIKYSMNSLEKLYVRDALYKEEIDKKIKITPEETIKGTFRSKTRLALNVISSGDSSEIFQIFSALKKGASFDSLLQLRPDDFQMQKTPVIVKFGQIGEEFIEDTLYNLKPGGFSHPLKTSEGWFIFKLKNRESVIFDNKKSDEISKEAKEVIRHRKALKLESAYLKKLLPEAKVEAVNRLFWRIVDKSTPLLAAKKALPENKKGKVYLDENDVSEMLKDFGTDSLNMTFIKINKNNVTLRDFLYSFVTDGFAIEDPSYDNVAGDIKTYLDTYIKNEVLSSEAYKKGLQNMPGVKREMQWWKENYTAHILRNQFLDSAKVSDEEVAEYYSKINSSGRQVTEVNIIEILTDRLEDIEEIMNALQKGRDFRELAKVYNHRESDKDNNGESGFFPVTMFGEIGKIAERMKIGEVYGPLKLTGGYSIFKLIDKKERSDSLSKSFDELKAQLKDDLFNQKLDNAFNKYTAKLASKYGVKVNKDVLNSINVGKVNMFTSRIMGFGGRIAAIPYTAPFYKWTEEWMKQIKLNP